ncbi:MaoC/PaaZ C-terminal domain-containing protein [Micropruina sp.]|uniref:MaoC/PaaZ C-terminal domain-containing protein n=1 Tax=Micropruina sp. TaxID=2737536 RepID=UPI0039E5DE5F
MADLSLEAMPGATGLYLRALAPTRRPDVAAGLPERAVLLSGHRCTVAEVAAYDRVCGFTLGDTLPATWLHVLTFPLQLTLMTAGDFPLAPAGMVHVRNELTQHRAALITEAFDLAVRAENLRPHRHGVLVDLIGEVRVGDELVWQGLSVYLSRHARLPGEPGADGPGGRGDGGDSDRGPYAPQAADAGAPVLRPAGLWRLPADLGRRYAAVSGDVNPIHLNPLAAQAFGFPRTIAHGMWSHARLLAALQPRLPAAFTARVQFAKPVLLPSTLRYAVAAKEHGYAAALSSSCGDRVHLTLDLARTQS